jgi:multiple sugar transport system permease protein
MKPRRLSPMAREDRMTFWCFISPWLIGFCLFGLGPILASIWLSFTNYSLFKPPVWVGLANYRELFRDPLILKSLGNTLFYVVFAVPLGTVGALMLALLLNQKVRGIAVWRTIFYLPTIVSGVAMGVLWRWIFNPEIGLANTLLRPVLGWLGIADPQWLLDPALAKPAYVLMSLWGMGGGMVIFLAALQGIPEHLYEAAELDGAGPVRQFFVITIPMLSPVILFSLTMGTIGSFQIFAQAYVMSGRGPDNSTLFYVLYLFDQAFRYFRMGYGAAMAWVLFAIVLGVTVLKFALAKRWVYYEGEA